MILDLAALLAVSLLVMIGLVHLYWASGGTRGLAYAIPTLDGTPMFRPGRWLTAAVALVLLGFALVAYLLRFTDLGSVAWGGYVVDAGWAIAGVLLLRAVGEFHAVGFFKKIKGTPFARCDTQFYSPLCLGLGTVFGAVTYLTA